MFCQTSSRWHANACMKHAGICYFFWKFIVLVHQCKHTSFKIPTSPKSVTSCSWRGQRFWWSKAPTPLPQNPDCPFTAIPNPGFERSGIILGNLQGFAGSLFLAILKQETAHYWQCNLDINSSKQPRKNAKALRGQCFWNKQTRR